MAIIEVKNLGKKYNIGERERYLALRDILTNIAKAPLSWMKSKVVGNQTEEFWALRDLSFKVEQGEVLGIIGRNGAGKSTLLKILSQITPPSTGEIKIKGRIGSLLEVGTGFHPELTGRENIYLNGAILGMRKKEIERKFDEIVEFAGIQQFLDTPVKRYSSGMYVRLAFAVAAHLEPEILLIDEVLAVGDAEFQKKCLGKMEEVTKKDGRTVLFVSHNMGAVQQLCPRSLLLDRGRCINIGPTTEVINDYLDVKAGKGSETIELPRKGQEVAITRITFKNSGHIPWSLNYKERLLLEAELFSSVDLPHFQFGVGIDNLARERLFTSHCPPQPLKKGKYIIQVSLENPLAPGTYSLAVGIASQVYNAEVATIEVNNVGPLGKHESYNYGFISVNGNFDVKRVQNC